MKEDITLDDAESAFVDDPSNKTAGVYLEALLEYHEDDMIGDETFFDGLAHISMYLNK